MVGKQQPAAAGMEIPDPIPKGHGECEDKWDPQDAYNNANWEEIFELAKGAQIHSGESEPESHESSKEAEEDKQPAGSSEDQCENKGNHAGECEALDPRLCGSCKRPTVSMKATKSNQFVCDHCETIIPRRDNLLVCEACDFARCELCCLTHADDEVLYELYNTELFGERLFTCEDSLSYQQLSPEWESLGDRFRKAVARRELPAADFQQMFGDD